MIRFKLSNLVNLDISTREGVINWRRLILAGCVLFWLSVVALVAWSV